MYVAPSAVITFLLFTCDTRTSSFHRFCAGRRRSNAKCEPAEPRDGLPCALASPFVLSSERRAMASFAASVDGRTAAFRENNKNKASAIVPRRSGCLHLTFDGGPSFRFRRLLLSPSTRRMSGLCGPLVAALIITGAFSPD